MTRRRAGRRGACGLDPRGRGRCGAARRSRPTSRSSPTRSTACSPTTTTRARARSRAATTGSRSSRGRTPPLALAAVLPPARRSGADRMRGRAATPASCCSRCPGGIGRYVASRCSRALPDRRRRAGRVRGRRRGPAACPRACRGSTSARRTAASATSCGTGSAARWCASTPTSCTRRASRSRPCATRRSSSPCTTSRSSASRACTTRRGVSVPPARPRARAPATPTLVLAPSAFTRVELIREGFDPEDVVRRAARRRPSRAARRRRDRRDRRARRRTRAVRADRRHGRAAQGPADDRRRDRSGSATRRPDLELVVVGPPGWGEVTGLDRPVRARARRAAVARRRRARTGARRACCIASRYEGFGLPALEAIARGAPLVVADDSALEEVVGDAGAAVPARRRRRAAPTRSNALLDDDELRAELRRRGPARGSRAHLGSARPRRTSTRYARAVALGTASAADS